MTRRDIERRLEELEADDVDGIDSITVNHVAVDTEGNADDGMVRQMKDLDFTVEL